jgi:hypothetical protein
MNRLSAHTVRIAARRDSALGGDQMKLVMRKSRGPREDRESLPPVSRRGNRTPDLLFTRSPNDLQCGSDVFAQQVAGDRYVRSSPTTCVIVQSGGSQGGSHLRPRDPSQDVDRTGAQ